MDDSRKEGWPPYRMTVPRTGCGFVFIPLSEEYENDPVQITKNLTEAHKHDQKLEKCIGVSVIPEGDSGYFIYTWCYLNGPWKEDPELDSLLRSHFPFRPVAAYPDERYSRYLNL